MAKLPETNEILKTGLSDEKPYLGSPGVVSGIVREYLHELTTIRSEQVQNEADAMPLIDAAAKRLQGVFYGEDDGYLPYAWNRESSLGLALVRDADIGGETGDAVYRLAVRMAKEFLSDLIAYENDTLDDEHFRKAVDALDRRYTMMLSGASTAGEDYVD